MTPAFSARHVAFVLMGGVFAQACVRGGGEYGREWHDAGRLARKQSSFDDFAAAARWLIDGKVTSPARLAIAGGSNGGLLVAATLNQHPDLFGAAVPAVGVLDMLRYQRFTVGRSWASDYGTSDDPEQFRWLQAYSPLHNVKPGASYPPVLVVTSDHDDRVVPGHSFKYAAALQAAQAGEAPILIRIETRGAPVGRAADRQIAESTDVLAFLARTLGGLTALGR
jgi:prolyl oligopeptidase